MKEAVGPLAGIKVVNLAINLPGPRAAARLYSMGASVLKIEPPGGDQMERLCPAWYEAMRAGHETRRLDLKTAEGRAELESSLEDCDVLITSVRPSSLRRLSLDWSRLHVDHPRLCHVAIVGYAEPNQELAGHDLTYVAAFGLVSPPALPRTVIADFTGGERAVSSALALLLARERGAGGGYAEVALADGPDAAADSFRYGLTNPGGILGGRLPNYGLYQTRDGWIALAALEPHFCSQLAEAVGIPAASMTREDLEQFFLTRTASEWAAWAGALNLPLAVVRDPEPISATSGPSTRGV